MYIELSAKKLKETHNLTIQEHLFHRSAPFIVQLNGKEKFKIENFVPIINGKDRQRNLASR